MTSAIKQRNPNPLTQSQVTDYVFAAKVTYTDDHAVTALEANKRISLGPLTAADKTFPLPKITALNDGAIYGIMNDSYYKLTLACDAADHVWNSGDGKGLWMYGKGCMVWVQADYNGGVRPVYDVIMRTGGGRVMVEGLVLHEKMDSYSLYKPNASTTGRKVDLSGRHMMTVEGNVDVDREDTSNFGAGCFSFDGTDDHAYYADSPDWDIFGTQTGVKTVAGWAYIATVARTEYFISHYTGGSYWQLGKTSAGEIFAATSFGGLPGVGLGTFSTGWHHIALVISGSDLGVYIDGVQMNHHNSWSVGTVSSSLYIGQYGGGNYFLGRMQDWHIAYNDTLGLSAAPDSGLTSTYTVPAAPMNLVM